MVAIAAAVAPPATPVLPERSRVPTAVAVTVAIFILAKGTHPTLISAAGAFPVLAAEIPGVVFPALFPAVSETILVTLLVAILARLRAVSAAPVIAAVIVVTVANLRQHRTCQCEGHCRDQGRPFPVSFHGSSRPGLVGFSPLALRLPQS